MAREMLGATQLLMNRPKDAVTTLDPAAKSDKAGVALLNLIGEAALRSGDSLRAQGYYQRAVAAKPDDTTARLNLGATKIALGQREEGIRIIEETVQEHPELKGVEYDLALKLLNQGATDQALAIANRLTTNEPKAAEPFVLLGLVRRVQGDLVGAQNALDTALANNPNHVGAGHALADVLLRKGEPDKAEAAFRQILKRQPGHLRTLLALSALQQARGQGDAAAKTVVMAMNANPKAIEPRLLVAQDHVLKGEPSRALALLQPLKADNATHPGLLQMLGQVYLATRQPAGAVVEFQKLATVRPTDANAHYLLAQAYAAAGDQQKSSAALDRALQFDPGMFPAQIAKVRTSVFLGKMAEADGALAALRKQLPNDANVDALEAWALTRKGKPAEAIAFYRKALAKAPSRAWTLELAEAQWTAGEQDASLKTLDDWHAGNPKDAVLAMTLANNFLAIGKRAEAVRVYQVIVTQQPNLWLALNNLADLLRKDDPKAALGYAKRAFGVAPNTPPVMHTLGQILTDQGQYQRALRLELSPNLGDGRAGQAAAIAG